MTRISAKYSVARSERGLAVKFVTSLPANFRRDPASFVCDLNRFGRLRGIETLDLTTPEGVDVLSAVNKETLQLPEQGKMTYDEEHEAFYLRLNDTPRSLAEKIEQDLAQGRGSDQKLCDGFLLLDTLGRLLGLEVGI